MIENLIIFGLIIAVLYLVFYSVFSNNETMEISRYDDKVIEVVGRRFVLVDARGRK